MARRDDLMKDGHQQIRMRACKHRNVHRHGGRVRFVQAHAKVPFARQQQENENANMHEADTRYAIKKGNTHTQTSC